MALHYGIDHKKIKKAMEKEPKVDLTESIKALFTNEDGSDSMKTLTTRSSMDGSSSPIQKPPETTLQQPPTTSQEPQTTHSELQTTNCLCAFFVMILMFCDGITVMVTQRAVNTVV